MSSNNDNNDQVNQGQFLHQNQGGLGQPAAAANGGSSKRALWSNQQNNRASMQGSYRPRVSLVGGLNNDECRPIGLSMQESPGNPMISDPQNRMDVPMRHSILEDRGMHYEAPMNIVQAAIEEDEIMHEEQSDEIDQNGLNNSGGEAETSTQRQQIVDRNGAGDEGDDTGSDEKEGGATEELVFFKQEHEGRAQRTRFKKMFGHVTAMLLFDQNTSADDIIKKMPIGDELLEDDNKCQDSDEVPKMIRDHQDIFKQNPLHKKMRLFHQYSALILNVFLILSCGNHSLKFIDVPQLTPFYICLSFYFFYNFLANYKYYDLFNYRQIHARFQGKFSANGKGIGNAVLLNEQNPKEATDEQILHTFQRKYGGMHFQYLHLDKVEAEVGLDYDQSKAGRDGFNEQERNKIIGLMKKGVAKKYESSLSKITDLAKYLSNTYNPERHTRYLRASIWHFDAVRARYFLALNPIFVSMATLSPQSGGFKELVILDIVIAITVCILLGLSIHDDRHTEGESLLSIALQVDHDIAVDKAQHEKQKNGKFVSKYLKYVQNHEGESE